MTPTQRDRALVDDLLFVLLGIDGQFIRLSKEKRFELVDTSDISLSEIVSKSLSIADAFVRVSSFVSTRSQLSFGRVNHAFAASVDTFIHKYLSLVTQLEQLNSLGNLSVSRLHLHLSSLSNLFSLLLSLVDECERKSLKGGQLVNLLYARHQLAGHVFTDCVPFDLDAESESALRRLLEAACVPYFAMLRTWLTDGQVDDPFGEFCIAVNANASAADSKSGSYWDEKFSVKADAVPQFLADHMAVILNTGKYLHVVRATGDENDSKALEESLNVSSLKYHVHHHEFVSVIKSAHKVASARLLKILLGKYELDKVLRSVKHYFFLDAGDLFVHFLDLAESELSKKAVDVFQPRLQSQFENAIRASSAKFDAFADSVRVALLPFKFLAQLQFIHEKSRSGQFDTTLSPPDQDLEKLLGVEAFCLSYEAQWPLSIVLSPTALSKYQLLFRVLFYYKVIERSLGQVWMQHIHTKQFDLGGSLSPTFALRAKMLNFVQTYQNFMLYEVIAPQWAKFQASLTKHETVDELMSAHESFLDNVMKLCALTDPAVIIVLSKLTSIAKIFADYSFRFMDSLDGDISSLMTQIKERLIEEGDDQRTADEYSEIHPNQLHRIATIDVSAEQTAKIRENDNYNKTIQKFEDNFNHFFRLFLDSLNKQSSDGDNGALATVLLSRLDYSGYFAKKFSAED